MKKIIIKRINTYKTQKGDLLFIPQKSSDKRMSLVISQFNCQNVIKELQNDYNVIPFTDIKLTIPKNLMKLVSKKYIKVENIIKVEVIEENNITKETPIELIINDDICYVSMIDDEVYRLLMIDPLSIIDIYKKEIKIINN